MWVYKICKTNPKPPWKSHIDTGSYVKILPSSFLVLIVLLFILMNSKQEAGSCCCPSVPRVQNVEESPLNGKSDSWSASVKCCGLWLCLKHCWKWYQDWRGGGCVCLLILCLSLTSASYSGVCLYSYWCLELANRSWDTKGRNFVLKSLAD